MVRWGVVERYHLTDVPRRRRWPERPHRAWLARDPVKSPTCIRSWATAARTSTRFAGTPTVHGAERPLDRLPGGKGRAQRRRAFDRKRDPHPHTQASDPRSPLVADELLLRGLQVRLAGLPGVSIRVGPRDPPGATAEARGDDPQAQDQPPPGRNPVIRHALLTPS